ncbi:MAG: nucleotidyltransferase family protein [Gemmatimonadaceae bacterium]
MTESDWDDHDPSEEELDELARRRAIWQSTGNPCAFWPSLEPHMIQAAADVIGRAVADMLRDSHATLHAETIDAEALGVAALLSGVGPLLGYWMERGALETSDAARPVLARHLRHASARSARIDAGMRPVLARLSALGITPAAIKGFHTAREYFPAPETRPFGDVDLVVHPEEVARVEAALREAGFVAAGGRDLPYKRDWKPPRHDGRVRSFHVWHAQGNWKVELHAGLAFDHLIDHKLQLDRVIDMSERWEMQGVPLRAPSGPSLVAMLAVHASGELYSSRLLRLVELVLVIRHERAAGRLDWRDVSERLANIGALRFAYPAFALVERLAPGTVDEGLVARTASASSALARRVVDGFTPTSPILELSTSLPLRLMWVMTARETAHRVWRMIAPPRGEPLGTVLRVYHSRLRRLITGAAR